MKFGCLNDKMERRKILRAVQGDTSERSLTLFRMTWRIPASGML